MDWVARVREDRQEFEQNEAKQKKEREENRKAGTIPTHDLRDYAGQYEHHAYGTVEIEARGETLTITLDNFSGELRHYHYDMFEVDAPPGNPLEEMLVTFAYNKKGDIDRILLPLERNVSDIIFARPAEPEEEEETP